MYICTYIRTCIPIMFRSIELKAGMPSNIL